MRRKLEKYKSPSTEGVEHDPYNLIVEAIMINRYGLIPSGSWRKGAPLHLEWGETVKVVKRLVTTMGIDVKRLAWYVRRYKITHLNYNEFGLVKYRILKCFKWENLDDFRQHYEILYKSQIKESSSYVEATTSYHVKEAAPQRKSLQEILQEIENGIEQG